MPVLSYFRKDVHISSRKLLAVTLFFSSSFAWFFVFYQYFDDIFIGFTSDFWFNVGKLIFLISTVVSASVGSALANRINRRKFLFLWIIFGALAVAPVPFVRGNELALFFSIIAGASFGVGFPSCMAFLAESTDAEERGRVSGFAILLSFAFVIIAIGVDSTMGFSSSIDVPTSHPSELVLLSIGIKLVGFFAFILDPISSNKAKFRSWRNIIKRKDFALYTLVYVLFNIAAGLVTFIWRGFPSTPEFETAQQYGQIIRYLGLGAFGMLAGLMADRRGRKIPIYLGLVMLAAGYMSVGFGAAPETYFINLVLSGFAWGIIMVIYLVVPGDLAVSGSVESYYAVGWLIPLTLLLGCTFLLEFIPATNIPISVFAYILSLILFSATIPIYSAKETLPETKKHKREIKEYLEDKAREYGKKSKET